MQMYEFVDKIYNFIQDCHPEEHSDEGSFLNQIVFKDPSSLRSSG